MGLFLNNLHAKISKGFVYFVSASLRPAYADLFGLKQTTLIDIHVHTYGKQGKSIISITKASVKTKRKV